MKTKKIIARVSAWLLMLAMLAVLVPTTISAENLDDHLLIHYDFAGDNPLGDKAGSVKSDLQVITKVNYSSDFTTIESVTPFEGNAPYTVENGVITTTSTDKTWCLAAVNTADVEATYGHGDLTLDGTYYLRVKLPSSTSVFLCNRNRNTGVTNWGPYMCAEGGVIKTMSGNNGAAGGSQWAAPSFVANEWTEIAITRDATAGISKMYIYQNGVWKGISQTGVAVDDYATAFALFGNIGAVAKDTTSAGVDSWSKNGSPSYDDVRFYNKALTVAELNEVHKEVLYSGSNLDNGTTTTASAGNFTDTTETAAKLLIHYDFNGDDWATVLADKSKNGVATNLSVLDGVTATVSGGAITNAYNLTNDEATIDGIFKFENGVLSAVGDTKSNVIVAGFTDDTKAIHNPASTDGLTVYMRVQVKNWSGWNTLLSMRTTGTAADYTTANNRVFNMELDGQKFNFAAGNNTINSFQIAVDPDGDNILELAAVRTTAAVDGYDTYTFYALTSKGWINLGSKTPTNAKDVSTYQHNTMDSATLLLGLFGGANGSKDGGKTNVAYDDIRIYNTALTVEQLNECSGCNVVMLGAQRSMNTFDNNQSYKVRLVAQINGDDWTDAGFKVTANDGTDLGTQDLKVNVAYTSILAQEDGGLNNVITASSGCYLISIVIEGIPVAKDTLTLTVTPYASDGTTPVEGKAVVITLENAQITSITWAN